MKSVKTILAIAAATVVGLGFAAPYAKATQISGTIGFTSAPNSSGGSITQSGGNTTVTFNNPMHVNFGSDDYTGVVTVPEQTVNFAPITFNSSGTLVSSNTPEWSFTIGATTYSFDLTNLVSASFTTGSPNMLALTGEGTAHITGFEDTFATFALQGTGKGFSFTILQASNTAVPHVPEGGSAVALLGLGLVAVEGLRRKLVLAKI